MEGDLDYDAVLSVHLHLIPVTEMAGRDLDDDMSPEYPAQLLQFHTRYQ